jgi:hypothetical protein
MEIRVLLLWVMTLCTLLHEYIVMGVIPLPWLGDTRRYTV